MLQGHGIGSAVIVTLLLVFWNAVPVNADGTGLPSVANARQIGPGIGNKPYRVSVNCLISNVGNNGPEDILNLGDRPIILIQCQFPPTPMPPGLPMPNRKAVEGVGGNEMPNSPTDNSGGAPH